MRMGIDSLTSDHTKMARYLPDHTGGENVQRINVRNTEWPWNVATDRSHGCLTKMEDEQ